MSDLIQQLVITVSFKNEEDLDLAIKTFNDLCRRYFPLHNKAYGFAGKSPSSGKFFLHIPSSEPSYINPAFISTVEIELRLECDMVIENTETKVLTPRP